MTYPSNDLRENREELSLVSKFYMISELLTNQRSRNSVHVFPELCMHIIKTFFSLIQSVLLKIPLKTPGLSRLVRKSNRKGTGARMFRARRKPILTHSLSPLFGSNGWSTVDACSSQSVKILGKD